MSEIFILVCNSVCVVEYWYIPSWLIVADTLSDVLC